MKRTNRFEEWREWRKWFPVPFCQEVEPCLSSLRMFVWILTEKLSHILNHVRETFLGCHKSLTHSLSGLISKPDASCNASVLVINHKSLPQAFKTRDFFFFSHFDYMLNILLTFTVWVSSKRTSKQFSQTFISLKRSTFTHKHVTKNIQNKTQPKLPW